MGANNTITTASSSSSGAPRRPTSFLTRNTCFDELFDYIPTMEEASETLEYEGSENSTVPEVQQWQDSAQYSPIVQTPTYGNAVASNYKVTSPCSKTPTLHASIESQAIKLHPPLQLGSATASANESVSQPSSSKCNCGMPLERAITLKSKYIGLIKELHQLAIAGAISDNEYSIQKSIILGQMPAL